MRVFQAMIVLFLVIFLNPALVFSESEESNKMGTIIVVYQTNSKGEFLDRVRFLLKDSKKNQRLFPKGNAFVEDANLKNRMVVIENLLPGEYTIDFLIPNKHAYYEEPNQKTVTLRSGEIVKVDYVFKEKNVVYYGANRLRDLMAWMQLIIGTSGKEVSQNYMNRPPRSAEMGIFGGSLNVQSNIRMGEWALFLDNRMIYKGKGSVSNVMIQPGRNYFLRAKEIPGYSVKVYPSDHFSIGRRQSFVARIVYHKAVGYIQISAQVPENRSIGVNIVSSLQSTPIHLDLTPQNGVIQWDSGAIPTGTYTFYFESIGGGSVPSPITVSVRENEHVQVTPDFRGEHSLTVESNTEYAVYLLEKVDSERKWQGSGMTYTFKGVPTGRYTLSFSSSNPQYLLPPEDQKVNVNDQTAALKAIYQINGLLEIETNVNKAQVTIIAQSNPSPAIKDEITTGKKSYQLTPGIYQVVVEQSGNMRHKNHQEITIKALETQTIRVSFEDTVKPNRQEQAQIIVISNIADAKYRIEKKEDQNQKIHGVYQGKYVSISVESKVPYEVIFDPIDNYSQPQSILFELNPGEHRIIRVEYIPAQKLIIVPEGKVILGDSFNEGSEDERPVRTAYVRQFLIGMYDVSNSLYANWLTDAVKMGLLIYLSDSEKKGQVIDLEGHLIFKTMESDSFSQITASKDSSQGYVFRPIPGKDQFPVINVTWYGANAYCKSQNCRLPTEAEWEKAASMSLERAGEPLKKFRYGFSQDEIDKTWANYKYNDAPITNFQVRTSEIGFYNGLNLLPLSAHDKAQLRTHDAKSPVGCYDMSGNVFQWVSDWYAIPESSSEIVNNPQGPTKGTKKITKGGSYDSLPEELRVSKRLPLLPDHCDAYTGFRVCR